MGKATNQARSVQLGKSYGAACGKLRKEIMFSLLVRLRENYCFKCKKEIKGAKDLTIEHKQPWFKVSNKLFWDLNNIAFSHSWCNKVDRPRNVNEKSAPKGKAWCSGCQEFLLINRFGLRKNRNGKPRGYCNECRRSRGWKTS